MSRVELLWRICSGNSFCSKFPASPIAGLFFPIVTAVLSSSSAPELPSGFDRSSGFDSKIQRYLRLIKELVEQEPFNQPFLPQLSAVEKAYHQASSASKTHRDFLDTFSALCLNDSVRSLANRAEEAGLTAELDTFLGDHLAGASMARTEETVVTSIKSGLMADVVNPISTKLYHFVGAQTGCVCTISCSIQENDQVWLLHGLPSMAVLRPCQDGSFQFRGAVSVSFLGRNFNDMDEACVNRETRGLWIR